MERFGGIRRRVRRPALRRATASPRRTEGESARGASGERPSRLGRLLLRVLDGAAARACRRVRARLLERARRTAIEFAPRAFARWCTPDDQELGRLGERLAELHLAARGLAILDRRRRTAAVEVDLLARDGARLVLVEVKTKRLEPVPRPRGMASDAPALRAHAERWRPGLRLSHERLARLASVARGLTHPGTPAPRVDLVEVLVGLRGRPIVVEHHPGSNAPSKLDLFSRSARTALMRRGFRADHGTTPRPARTAAVLARPALSSRGTSPACCASSATTCRSARRS
ncbi:MAG: YraN family protein [Planctomycetes bacterium]|nr:YraN family protein [Planctomycetota bacterium]